jgi:hypothetical protein
LALGVSDGFCFPPGAGVGVGVADGDVLCVVVPGALMHHDVCATFVVIDLYAACAAA